MRPEILFPIFADVSTLDGVGPRVRTMLERLTGTRLADLIWHLPISIIDRRWRPTISGLEEGRIATVEVDVLEHQPARNKKAPYRVICQDETGEITLVFFHARESYLRQQLPEGQKRLISGQVEFFKDKAQMTHPDYILPVGKADEMPDVEPVYPLTTGLSLKVLLKAVKGAMKQLPDLPEWQDASVLKKYGWTGWHEAVEAAHAPKSLADVSPSSAIRQRLAYDELLANQMALMLVRSHNRKRRGRELNGTDELRQKVRDALPYELTGAQIRTLAEIDTDLESPDAMLRLVQGDVGSGKTIVAFLAMMRAVEAGAQAAMVAPTEILARQHIESMKPFADAAGIRMDILTGRDKGKPREALLADLASGKVDVLVGTHAIFQADVHYHDLAVTVIDEQHRFGVQQRMALAAKGSKHPPDVLAMTATPIPRTLSLTVYGDMDISKLDEKPPGRQPIETRVIALSRLGEIAEGIKRAVNAGQQVYWVCPLVDESEVLDLAAAEDRHQHLKKIMPDKVGLIHGRMKSADKDEVMARFQSGDYRVLVATTVIEVGVDVPNATIMVIEHAERFGLSQLHQLRGRVGRGSGKSTCLLLRTDHVTDTAHDRLTIMRETEDGFRIAEEDLRLRGAGEVLGTRQSGFPKFRVADMAEHGELLAMARDEASIILQKDPDLSSARGKALKVLLYLFERDGAVQLMKSG